VRISRKRFIMVRINGDENQSPARGGGRGGGGKEKGVPGKYYGVTMFQIRNKRRVQVKTGGGESDGWIPVDQVLLHPKQGKILFADEQRKRKSRSDDVIG